MPVLAPLRILESSGLEALGAKVIDKAFLGRKPSWVGGQISGIDSVFLSGLIQEIRPARLVEIGVASGWSSSVLLASLRASAIPDFRLTAIDLFPEYYLDKSIPTGRAVVELLPELLPHYELLTGAYAFDAMEKVGEVDFAFIDAHHMHPWTALDLISVLPFIRQGAWVALHDINLCRIGRHMHKNRGPFYLFNMWPGDRLNSTEGLPMIGAVNVASDPNSVLPFLMEVLCTPWEVPVDNAALSGLAAFVEKHFGSVLGAQFQEICGAENEKVRGRH